MSVQNGGAGGRPPGCRSLQAEQRAAVVAEALTWLGTPWRHRGRVKGVGVDCAQFVLKVYAGAGLVADFDTGEYPRDWHIHRRDERFLGFVTPFVREIAAGEVGDGDLVLCKIGHVYSHGVIVTHWPQGIHAAVNEGAVMLCNLDRDAGLVSGPRRFFTHKGWLSTPNEGGGGDSPQGGERVGANPAPAPEAPLVDGSAVDAPPEGRKTEMAGRQASQAITRYSGIQVQTSALGLQIPVGWGTFRCRCNLVDYFNFQSKAQKAAAAGKGGSTTTGFTYSASLVLAICEGPIDAVTQVWVNGKEYAHASNGSGAPDTGPTSAAAQVGLTLALGAIGQAPWGSLPADHAIGYSGLAIAYAANYPLNSSASTPNHSFEVVKQAGFAVGGGYAGPDVDPSLVVADFFNNTRTGVPGWPAGLLDTSSLTAAANSFQKYCLAAGLLVSPVLDQQRGATDFLNELLLATNSTVVWSEGLLKFIAYGDTALTGNGVTYTPNNTPVYSLGDDDYIVKQAGDVPLTVGIQDQSDAYNIVQIEYLDRGNQYNMAIALASDAANVDQYGPRRKDPDTVHVICTPTVAAIAAQLWLQRTLYIRAQYRFRLSWAFALLEPGDLLELTDAGLGLAAYTVRILQIDEDEKDGTLDLTCEDYPIGVHHAPLYTMQVSAPVVVSQTVDPGGVEANLLLWTGDFTNGAWTKSALTVTAAAAANPVTGASDATKLTPSTANTPHQVQQATGTNTFAGANYTQTIYAKSDGYSQVELLLADPDGDAIFVSVDLGSGAILAQGTTQIASAVIGAEQGGDITTESGSSLEQDP